MKCIPGPLLLAAAVVGLAPAAQAARRDGFDAPFVPVPAMMADDFFKTGPRLDFPGPGPSRTELYPIGVLPKAPVFHPYNFYAGNTRPCPDSGDGRMVPEYLLNMRLSADFAEALPPNLAAKLATLAIPLRDLEIYCEVQTQAWPNDQMQSFRPHYWANPNAPACGKEHTHHRIHVGIYDAPPSIRFVGHRASECFPSMIVIHPQPTPAPKNTSEAEWKKQDHPMVSSPSNLRVHGLDYRRTTCFWTLCQLDGNGQVAPRVAATLHVLLNDPDTKALKAILPRVTSLRSLIRELDRPGSRLEACSLTTELKQLSRPIITRCEAAGSGVLTLIGSGFSDVGQVTIGGQKAQVLEADDSHLKVKTAGGSDQRIRVDTPMGSGVFPLTSALVPDPPPVAGELEPALPNLWEEKGVQVLTIPEKAKSAEAQRSQACAPGEVFVGECEVRAVGMISNSGHDQAHAGLGLRFENAARQEIGTGDALGYDHPTETHSPVPVRLRIGGKAPAGTASVTFLLQAKDCEPGAQAFFDAVSFKRLPPAPAAAGPARPVVQPTSASSPAPASAPAVNLWPAEANGALAVPDQPVVLHTLRFKPGELAAGEVFTGEAYVRTEAMQAGNALIGIRFDCENGQTAFGGRWQAQLPTQSASADRVRVGVHATAPAGVVRVTLSIQTRGCNPGAKATFDSVTFRRLGR